MSDAAPEDANREREREQMRARKKRYRERHPERVREQERRYQRAYYQRNRDVIRLRVRLAKYGLTAEDLDRMRIEQRGRCPICGVEIRPDGSEHVDHCHRTGRIRALLCSPCNRGLGMVDDDPVRLRRMADYVEAHRAEQ